MAKPASFEELDRAIGDVLDAETTNFFELAEMLGLDPKRDFAGADLAGTDLSEGDLSYANFAATNFKGANLASTNLRGADLGSANLQGAILTNADLSFANLGFKIDFGRAKNITSNLIKILTPPSTRARARGFILERTFGRTHARNFDLDRALDHARALDRALHRIAHSRDSARIRGRDSARTLYSVLNSARALDRAFDRVRLDRARARLPDRTLDLVDELTYVFTNTDSAADLTGAEVKGTIMIGCLGLSGSDAANLKRRGAIFDDASGDRSEAYSPVPR